MPLHVYPRPRRETLPPGGAGSDEKGLREHWIPDYRAGGGLHCLPQLCMFILLKGKGGQEARGRQTVAAEGRVVDGRPPGQVNAAREQEMRQTLRSLIPGGKMCGPQEAKKGTPSEVLWLTWYVGRHG